MKLWINVLSANEDYLKPLLPSLANSGEVPIYSSVDQKVIGKTLRYEIRNEIDLWAESEIDEDATPFQRAAGVLAQSGGEYFLGAVLATDFSRDKIRQLTTRAN